MNWIKRIKYWFNDRVIRAEYSSGYVPRITLYYASGAVEKYAIRGYFWVVDRTRDRVNFAMQAYLDDLFEEFEDKNTSIITF